MLHGLTRLSALIALGLMLGLLSLVVLVPRTQEYVAPNTLRLAQASDPTAPVAPLETGGVEVKPDTAIRLLFVGDIMLDRNVLNRTVASKSDYYSFEKLPSGWFDSYDYAVANLEGSLTDKRRPPEKSIDFQFDPKRWLPVLKKTGIDAFSQANNHALDQGAEGYKDSVKRLRDAGFLVFGHQVQDDAIALATTTIRGKTVGFLGYNTTDNPLDQAAASKTINEVKPTVDWLIVYMHWGNEYRDKPDAPNVDRAKWFIDQGVDVVIGGHPHWVQGISSYKGKPIVYSLGNFIFDQDFSEETRQGLALGLSLEPGHIELQPMPTQVNMSQPMLSDADKQKRLDALAAISDVGLRDQIKAGKVTFACDTICRK